VALQPRLATNPWEMRPLRVLSADRRAPTADSASAKSASHFSDLFINFKC
jgi:hypothetical protein